MTPPWPADPYPVRPAPGDPVVPAYGAGTLGAVLPGAASALGVETGLPALAFPRADRVCVVLVDGLGDELLAEAAADGHAPFLSGLMVARRSAGLPRRLRVGFPTTTATSMGSFGTGLPPGRHGLVGYRVRDPARGVLLHELQWDPYTDPVDWQPRPTILGTLAAAGVDALNIGAEEFAGSGLTAAAFRGSRFTGTAQLSDRVDAALAMLATPGPRLAYLYWGAVDTAGHEHGWRSKPWQTEVRALDRQLARLAAALPAGTLLVITADHGMVDVPHASRLDIATRPELRRGIALLGGEPRMVQLYCRDDSTVAVARTAARFADAVDGRAWVVTRAEAIAAGWFGPVDDRVVRRIGDVLVAARGDFALIDSETMRERALKLIGHHGSLTDAEQLVPLLTLHI
jgi:hypothetical protein